MCGIVGYTGKKQAAQFLLDGLATLEYRGYDSAGVEVLSPDGELHGVKCAGRVSVLADRCKTANLTGTTGIAHTRWATHGAPTDKNAHPHLDCTGRIAIVHNGIIENYRELRSYLARNGHTFASDTDSEVVAHLVEDAWNGPCKGDLVAAVSNAVSRLEGSWALAVVCADAPGQLVVARNGSPLVVASTPDGAYAASDVTPLASVTSHVIQLENSQVALLEQSGKVTVYDAEGTTVEHPSTFDIDWDASAATLGGYADFMEKEIAEQPEAIERLLKGRLGEKGVLLDELRMSEEDLAAVDRIFIIACGTSYHVGLIARTLIQTWAHVPVVCEYASEFNYEQDVLITDHTLCMIITQSGETADTLRRARVRRRALRAGRPGGLRVLHEGLHGPDGRLRALCAAPGTGQRPHGRHRGERPLCRPCHAARPYPHRPLARLAGQAGRCRLPPCALSAVPRPRGQLHHRLRGRPQAQGDQLPARRGVPRRRDEAWSYRPARAGLPGGGHRP